jgi:ABC-2 type transport system permease protein
MVTIIRKELADYFTSLRCLILFILVLLASAAGIYAAYQGIRDVSTESGFVFINLFITSGENIPSLAFFVSVFVPIIGITLGFDAINREYSSGTMSRILSQPIYRDSVINGKFLAGVITLTIMMATTLLIVAGYGLRMIGVPPNAEEIIRLFIYFVSIVVYGAFWVGLATLFSVIVRNLAISLLASVAVWIFFGNPIFNLYTDFIVPAVTKTPDVILMLQRFSPSALFGEAVTVLLLPVWRGTELLLAGEELSYMLFNPLPLGQSLLLVWPQLTTLIGLAAVCFAVSYIVFMRQEIRAT